MFNYFMTFEECEDMLLGFTSFSIFNYQILSIVTSSTCFRHLSFYISSRNSILEFFEVGANACRVPCAKKSTTSVS